MEAARIPKYNNPSILDEDIIEGLAVQALAKLRAAGIYSYEPTNGVIEPAPPVELVCEEVSALDTAGPSINSELEVDPEIYVVNDFNHVRADDVTVKPATTTRRRVVNPKDTKEIEPKPATKREIREKEEFDARQEWLEKVDPAAKKKAQAASKLSASESTVGYGTSESHYIKSMTEHKILSREEEVMLARRIERGDLAAKEKLVLHNIRLVVTITRPYSKIFNVPHADLIDEGVMGLIRASEKFDHRRGYKFSTYATNWVKQATQRAIYDKERTIRLPVHLATQLSTIERARSRLMSKHHNINPTDEMIAAETGFELEKVQLILEYARVTSARSLDAPVKEDSVTSLGQLVKDASNPSDSDIAHDIYIQGIRDVVDRLPYSDRKILSMKFGLDDYEEMKNAAIARELGITRAKAERRTEEALERLEATMRKRGYTGYEED